MPVQPSYPGVYIEEVPSSIRTITGVPTSITAFVGTALRGPDSGAEAIGGLIDYDRKFGSTSASMMGVAVSLYFRNGGAQALIVRVCGKDEAAAVLTLPGSNAPKLMAMSKGAWGTKLLARVEDVKGDGAKPETFTYTLLLKDSGLRKNGGTGRMERYVGVSTDRSSPRSLIRLLRSSALVIVDAATAFGVPKPHDAVAPGTDPFDPQTKTAVQPDGGTSPSASGASISAGSETSTTGTSTPGTTTTGTSPSPRGGAAGAAGNSGGGSSDNFSTFVLSDTAKAAKPPAAADYDGDGIKQALTAHDAFFNILVVVPPSSTENLTSTTLGNAAKIAFDKRAFMIVDAPDDWADTDAALQLRDAVFSNFTDPVGRNAALYFPRVVLDDLGADADASIDVTSFPASGALAGLYARTDTERGVWKAPAGIDTGLGGTIELTQVLSDFDSGRLNPVAINALRTLPILGNVIWGARTMVGSDLEASQWKYIPIRRLALFIEESLYRGTQWVVFEPNDEPLWAQVRLNVGTFMNTLFRQGAFQGAAARDAYFVKCDRETNPQEDIDRGIVNIMVGFAPLKPAEFVIIQLQQISPLTAI